tara:strand:- start:350 stop:589 length:240 start_codon:yes stop_codon:yes gene_type:complete
MSKKKKSVKEIKAEQKQIMDSRALLALMLASAATAWKTGVPYSDLLANAERQNLKADSYFLDLADSVGTMFTMVEAEDK